MSRKGKLASRSLEYHAPATPKFLQALQSQISASQRHPRHDELDHLVASCSSSAKRKVEQGEEGLDSDDEIAGAQVVVLKEGKHLSQHQAVQLKTQQRRDEHDRDTAYKTQSIACSGSTTKKRRLPISTQQDAPSTRRTTPSSSKNSLDDVKKLIQTQRTQSQPKRTTKPSKKHKPGQNLSFNLDQDD